MWNQFFEDFFGNRYDEQRSDAGDSMFQSNGMRFTALDQDSDENDNKNCAKR